VKRTNEKKIKPTEQVLAPDNGGDARQLAVCRIFEIDDDAKIEVVVIKAEDCSLWRGGDDREPARRTARRQLDRF